MRVSARGNPWDQYAERVVRTSVGCPAAGWLDGDIRGFLDIVESEPVSQDGWTGFASMFGTRLYAGSREQSGDASEEIPF